MAGRAGDGGGGAAAPAGVQPPAARAVPGALVGRAADCAALEDLVQAVSRGLSRSLVLVGEPGIGKTRLLQYTALAAGGLRTVSIAGVESELRLGFAAVHRMLLPFLDRIGTLPPPQRDALGSAFGLAAGPPADRFLVGLGALTLFAEVAGDQPLIWLVDDAQWLDRESLEVLGFVGRRLYADSIGLLFGARETSPGLTALDGLPTRQLGGLEPGAARALLATSVAGPVNARVAARIITETGGNPLALLELAGLLTPDQLAGRSPLPQRLPVGRRMQGHFLRQVRMLPPATGSLLLLASAGSGDDPAALWRAAARLGLGPQDAEPAVAQDIISLEPRVAFRHPLIRSAVYEGARPGDRRTIHDALASVAGRDGDPDQAAWHHGAAAVVPDADVAADLERSAARAERRGGYVAQAAFLARAAELTPDAQGRAVRLFAAAQAYLVAGDGVLAEALLDQAAPRLAEAGTARGGATPPGRDRRVLLAAQGRARPPAGHRGRRRPARRAPDPRDALRGHAGRAGRPPVHHGHHDRRRGPGGAQRCRETPPRHRRSPTCCSTVSPPGPPSATRRRSRCCAPPWRLFLPPSRPRWPAYRPPSSAGSRRMTCGTTRDGGRHSSTPRPVQRRHGALGGLRITLAGLTTGAAWAGRPDEAEARYLEAAEISSLIGVPAPATTGVLLELRAWQGREQESRALAEMTAQWGRERGAAVLEVFALMGLTILELGLGRYAEALSSGMRIYDDDPPGFGNRVLPEIVEAATRSGERRAARAALGRLADRATASGTPWALGMLARSRALLAPGSGAEPSTRRHWRTCPAHRSAPNSPARICCTGNGCAGRSAAGTPDHSCAPRAACSTPWGRPRSPTAPGPSCSRRATPCVSRRSGRVRT